MSGRETQPSRELVVGCATFLALELFSGNEQVVSPSFLDPYASLLVRVLRPDTRTTKMFLNLVASIGEYGQSLGDENVPQSGCGQRLDRG